MNFFTNNEIKSLRDIDKLLVGYRAGKDYKNSEITYGSLTESLRESLGGPKHQYAIPITATPTTNAAVANDLGYLTITEPFTVASITASAFVAPTGSVLRVKVNLNGSGISGTINIPAGDVLSNNEIVPTDLVVGDVLSFDITQVGSTTPGDGITVYVTGVLD